MYFFRDFCPDCGAKLTHDVDRKVGICQKCDKSFDAEVISDDKMGDMADSLRKQGAFDKAAEFYNIMLKNESNNFSALKGLMLCENRLGELSDLSRALKEGTFVAANTDFSSYKWKCKADDKDYFDTAEKMFSLAADYKDVSKKLDEKEKDIRKTRDELQKIKDGPSQGPFAVRGRRRLRAALDYNPVRSIIGLAIAFGMFLMLTILFMWLMLHGQTIDSNRIFQACLVSFPVLFGDIAMLISIAVVAVKAVRIKKTDELLAKHFEERDAINKELETIRKDINKLNWNIKKYN